MTTFGDLPAVFVALSINDWASLVVRLLDSLVANRKRVLSSMM
jgi:hypothetical protein